MKINWNTKYTTIAIYSFIVASSVIIFYLSLSQLTELLEKIKGIITILSPFFIGLIIAYLLDFVLRFYEDKILSRKCFKSIKDKVKRIIAIALTYISAVVIFALFIQFVVPQLIDSIVGLINDVPTYIEGTNKFINNTFDKLDLSKKYLDIVNENVNELIDYVLRIAREFLPILGNIVRQILSSIWNIVLGIIISIYLLIEKRKLIAISRKITCALLPTKVAEKTLEISYRSNQIFGKFLSGKILDSCIIGILTFVILNICNIPYTLLISVVVGVTNIIPFFGPFIGAVPCFVIILFVSPIKAIWFLVIILVIQQIDGNIIGPKILGDSVGLSAFWVLFSILVAGNFFGFAGMILGVPVFAVFYSLIKEYIENKLNKKGLKTDTKDYIV